MSPAPANRSKSPFAHPEGTVAVRLQLERLVNAEVQLPGRVGGARPGRKALTLVDAMVAGTSHIDHADILRSGGTPRVLPFRVMASFHLGHLPAGPVPMSRSPSSDRASHD